MSSSFTNQVLAQIELFTRTEDYPSGSTCCPAISTRRWPCCTSDKLGCEAHRVDREAGRLPRGGPRRALQARPLPVLSKGPIGCRRRLPGTFDPPTVAHIAIAEAAISQGALDRVDLVVSATPLGKQPTVPTLADRLRVLDEVASSRPWLAVVLTEQRLIADIAAGYQAVVLGADKWLQVIDPVWYESETHRDRAVTGLPQVLVAPRPPYALTAALPGGPGPPGGVLVLKVDESHGAVSSNAVRQGRGDWMLTEAAAFDALTGAWSDPDRYLRSSSGG